MRRPDTCGAGAQSRHARPFATNEVVTPAPHALALDSAVASPLSLDAAMIESSDSTVDPAQRHVHAANDQRRTGVLDAGIHKIRAISCERSDRQQCTVWYPALGFLHHGRLPACIRCMLFTALVSVRCDRTATLPRVELPRPTPASCPCAARGTCSRSPSQARRRRGRHPPTAAAKSRGRSALLTARS